VTTSFSFSVNQSARSPTKPIQKGRVTDAAMRLSPYPLNIGSFQQILGEKALSVDIRILIADIQKPG